MTLELLSAALVCDLLAVSTALGNILLVSCHNSGGNYFFFFKEVYAFKKAFGGEEVLMVTILIMALDIQYKYLIYCYLD